MFQPQWRCRTYLCARVWTHQIRLCQYCHYYYAIIPIFPVTRMWSCSVNMRVDNQDRLSLSLTKTVSNIIFIGWWCKINHSQLNEPVQRVENSKLMFSSKACSNTWAHHRSLKHLLLCSDCRSVGERVSWLNLQPPWTDNLWFHPISLTTPEPNISKGTWRFSSIRLTPLPTLVLFKVGCRLTSIRNFVGEAQ